MKLYYNRNLKARSRKLRKSGVLSEVLLWNILKGRKIQGHQFTRQKPIDQFIVDFYCSKLRLVIEVDGYSHEDKFKKDEARQKRLESLGITVLRFKDLDVKKNINQVLDAINSYIEKFESRDNHQTKTTP